MNGLVVKHLAHAGIGAMVGAAVVLSFPKTVLRAQQIYQILAQSPTPIPPPSGGPTSTPAPTKTPSPTPSPTPIPVIYEQLEAWFDKYSSQESVSRELLRKIAICESHFKTNAVNGIYGGMYQFSPSTWKSTRRRMNLDPDPQLRFNAEESIKTAAFVLATRGPGAWPNCHSW